MASKTKRPQLDGDAIAKAIARDLPGWKLAKPDPVADAAAADAVANAQPGTNLDLLRRKFLGADAADSGGGGADDYGQLEGNRTTVQVEPDDGGPEKTADIVGGQVKIVQG